MKRMFREIMEAARDKGGVSGLYKGVVERSIENYGVLER